jgi:hypothetical protein
MSKESWRTSTVLAIAQSMRASDDFSSLPVLADAMEDAGFDDFGVLHSARNDAHAGNWIVGLVLNECDASYKWLEEYAEQINNAMRYGNEEEDLGDEPVTVERLLEVARNHLEGGGDQIWFGLEHHGEPFTTLVEVYRKHAEIVLRTAIYQDGESFYPFRCSC